MCLFVLFLLCGTVALLPIEATPRKENPIRDKGVAMATVYWERSEKAVVLKEGVMLKDGDAFGFYNDSLYQSGWGVLELRAGYGAERDPDTVMYLAGYLEGYLTARQMGDHYKNMYPQLITDPTVASKVKDFLQKQFSWARDEVHRKGGGDPLWRHVGYVLSQLDGLHAGALEWAKRSRSEPLSLFAVHFLNGLGDLLDLISMLFPGNHTDWHSLSWAKQNQDRTNMGHCSALIKVLPGFENVFISHSSWFSYAATMRIFKHWDFKLEDQQTATGRQSFSSYPGFLMSLDDFYLLGSGLVMVQTTNGIYNHSLFKLVTPQSLLAWQRVRVSNMMARDGKEWASVFSKYNSGTYNNQYMVVDLNKIHLQQDIEEGALFIIEQIPGLVEFSDQTSVLRRGYWPSYNIPFHERIYARSGYPAMRERFGMEYSYDLCPRAKIFRRDQGSVRDLASLRRIMRYNEYQADPYSEGDACKTICCRGDLKKDRPVPGGCYDTKVTDFKLAQKFISEAVNGPTVQGGLPAFSWREFSETRHAGLPESYNFTFLTMQPVLLEP